MEIYEEQEKIINEGMGIGQIALVPDPVEAPPPDFFPEDDEEEYLMDIYDTPENRLMETIENDRRRTKRQESAIRGFLGKGKRIEVPVIFPQYYGELLIWALHRYIEIQGWQVIKTLSFNRREPRYRDVNTGPGKTLNLLSNGTLFLQKGKGKLIATIDLDYRGRHTLVVKGPASRADKVTAFAEGVENLAREENFYRGNKLSLKGVIFFIDLQEKNWEDIALNPAIKEDIRANTVGFLAKSKILSGYGVPARRGVILAGAPGTGKTLICKALMSECQGITCILGSSAGIIEPGYVAELYELAQDLAPSIVFIEDLDQIGQHRAVVGSNPAMLTLLSVLDGVEAQKEIVTVATTNFLDILDQALSRRPSRFDRVIELALPGMEEREGLIARLCEKAPLDKDSQQYIARKTEGFTPAQVQEVIYDLIIKHVGNNGPEEHNVFRFSNEEVESAIRKIGRNNGHRMGFAAAPRTGEHHQR